MAEAKPFASLSSGLLARKGAAKPAMRPQGFGQMGMGLEDLGWNDMGHAHQSAAPHYHEREQAPVPEHVPSSIAALTPSPRHHSQPQPVEAAPPAEVAAEIAPPPVVEQQRAVQAAFAEAPKPVARPARSRSTVARTRSAPGAKGKAAFTLRLDPDRHLKLRLACAVTHRSAQQIVTEALDEFLESLPEIDAIASHVPAKAAGKTN
jgi:predicted transcriptional regulator